VAAGSGKHIHAKFAGVHEMSITASGPST
jgi:hypothetical protein